MFPFPVPLNSEAAAWAFAGLPALSRDISRIIRVTCAALLQRPLLALFRPSWAPHPHFQGAHPMLGHSFPNPHLLQEPDARCAEICRYRKDILSQTKRCLHSQVGEPPSLLHHRIHLLISDCARGLFANLLREPAYPWKALTALLFTAHSGSQSRNFPQRTLFPSHST